MVNVIKKLILVRHGKACGLKPGQSDFDRELTDEARSFLASVDGFMRSFYLLDAHSASHATLWSSPAVRAMQTAQEVDRALGFDHDIVPVDSIWEQDADTFAEQLATTDADCLVVVGHIPMLNEMIERLSGVELSLKPGGMAAIDMDESGRSGMLEWFVQGPVSD